MPPNPPINSSSDFPIRTPVTYLNYLSPQDVTTYEVSRNIFLAVVGAALMELLESIPGDIKVFKLGINPTVIAYALSRPAAILFGLLAILAKSPNTMDCQTLELAEFACCFVAMTTSSFLFLRRVQAVWINNKIISVVFSFIWLTGVAFDALLFDVTKAGPLADTGYCIITNIKGPWGAGAPIVTLIFDTLVFLCISYKLATEYRFHDNGAAVSEVNWSTIMSGKALPRLARAVLRGGQQYYLIAVIANLFLVVFMAFPLTSLELAVAPTPVAIIIISTSACRVFRNLRLSARPSTEILDNSRSMKFDLPTHIQHNQSMAHGGTTSSTYLTQSTNPSNTTTDNTLEDSRMGSTVITLEHMDTLSGRKNC